MFWATLGWGMQKQSNTLHKAWGMLHDTAQKLFSMVRMWNVSFESLVHLWKIMMGGLGTLLWVQTHSHRVSFKPLWQMNADNAYFPRQPEFFDIVKEIFAVLLHDLELFLEIVDQLTKCRIQCRWETTFVCVWMCLSKRERERERERYRHTDRGKEKGKKQRMDLHS